MAHVPLSKSTDPDMLLFEAGAPFESLLDAITMAVLVVDDAGRVATANAQVERLFGYDRDELIGASAERLLPAMTAGSDGFGLRKDGREIPVDVGLNAVDLNGRHYVVASIVDRADRNRAYEVQQMLAAIVESADDAIVTKDLNGIIRTWNAGAVRLLGYTADEIVGLPITRLIPADRLDEEIHIIERIRRGERVAHLETLRRAKDGSLLSVSLSVSPVRNSSGTIVGASKIMRDISERRRTEELQAVNAELESFSYSVSHDLRAPARAVLGFSEVLLEDYGTKLGVEGRRMLAVVRDEAARMRDVIDDLLRLAYAGQQPMRCDKVDMDHLAREVVAEQQSRGAGTAATVRIASLPAAFGDRSLLRHVWENLVSNALKYSSRSERPSVAIEGTLDGRLAVFSVRDNGVGFDMKDAAKLFGVFQRLHRADEFAGTGVGLAIVQRIVARHGGTIRADAMPGAGAVFTFALPAHAAASDSP